MTGLYFMIVTIALALLPLLVSSLPAPTYECRVRNGREANYEDTSCGSYWECRDFVGVSFKCREDEQFDFRLNTCQPNRQVWCQWQHQQKGSWSGPQGPKGNGPPKGVHHVHHRIEHQGNPGPFVPVLGNDNHFYHRGQGKFVPGQVTHNNRGDTHIYLVSTHDKGQPRPDTPRGVGYNKNNNDGIHYRYTDFKGHGRDTIDGGGYDYYYYHHNEENSFDKNKGHPFDRSGHHEGDDKRSSEKSSSEEEYDNHDDDDDNDDDDDEKEKYGNGYDYDRNDDDGYDHHDMDKNNDDDDDGDNDNDHDDDDHHDGDDDDDDDDDDENKDDNDVQKWGYMCGSKYGHEPNLEDRLCRSFWRCDDYKGSLIGCKSGHLYDYGAKACRPHLHVRCQWQHDNHMRTQPKHRVQIEKKDGSLTIVHHYHHTSN